MEFDFSKLNPFRKRTLEARAETHKIQIIISRSANDADKHTPHCVRDYKEGRNHAYKTKSEVVAYIIQTYQDNFEIKDFERLQQTEIDDYRALIGARKQQLIKK